MVQVASLNKQAKNSNQIGLKERLKIQPFKVRIKNIKFNSLHSIDLCNYFKIYYNLYLYLLLIIFINNKNKYL